MEFPQHVIRANVNSSGGTDIPVGDRTRYSVAEMPTRVEEYLAPSQARMPVPPSENRMRCCTIRTKQMLTRIVNSEEWMKFSRWIGILTIALGAVGVRADDPLYEQAPINYSNATPHDPVVPLQHAIDQSKTKLTSSDRQGYLESLLKDLKIPVSSQTLVFSKTSFQRTRISPKNPRALYFNDDTYVGFVPGGDVIEIASTDPTLGTIFYTLDQRTSKITRQTESCLQCHGESMTHDIPGLLVRSVYPDSDGEPILPAGTFVTTQESPLKERWGGWYVSGAVGGALNMANKLFQAHDGQQDPDAAPIFKEGSTDLGEKIDTSAYLTPRSDPVALLVLAHQTEAHNRMTQAAYGTLRALRDEKILNDALGEPTKPGEHSDSISSRIKSSCEPLVEYLLFSNEAPLPAPIADDPAFTTEFAAKGPRDAKGRSLRDFDLKTRIFRYPCSYLIESQSFEGLPDETKTYVRRRVFEVLSDKDTSKPFANLSAQDRADTLDILRQTDPAFRDLH